MRPLLLLTIDVEEDMPGWNITDPVSVSNVHALHGLADVCAELGVRPTYLCTYPMVTRPESRAVLKDLFARGDCEIGTHLHPWNTPPFDGVPGRDGDERSTPYYQFELGPERFRAKLETLHAAITALTGAPPTAFRAGRFGIDAATLRELLPLGYEVDSSVTPLDQHIDGGGPDFRNAPRFPYRPARHDVGVRGDLDIVEVPVSVAMTRRMPRALRLAFVYMPPWMRLRGLLSSDWLGLVDFGWLYPARFELDLMKRLTTNLRRSPQAPFNVFLHSNELAEGTSGRSGSRSEAEGAACLERTRDLLRHCLETHDAEPVTLTEAARRLAPTLGG